MIEATTVDPRPLTVLYRDEHVVAIDKPAGLQVHRSRISAEDSDFVLQRLRDQIGQLLYPVHRLDRPTSGVLLFALNPDAARALTAQFQARSPRRRYLAIVRGYTELEGRIERPLRNAPDKPARDAVTCYRRLATVELPYAVSRYPTSRYSLVDVRLHTGRHHQIRRHFNHISHPVIGDTTYGQGAHNRLFREEFAIHRLLLHAHYLRVQHPVTEQPLIVSAPLPPELERLIDRFGWHHVRQELADDWNCNCNE